MKYIASNDEFTFHGQFKRMREAVLAYCKEFPAFA